MKTPATSPTQHQSGAYDIRLRGHLDLSWAERLGVPTLVHEAGGTTLLRVLAADQAALHGLLQRIRDLGVPLISVIHVPTSEAN
jgi:hypothetical protein